VRTYEWRIGTDTTERIESVGSRYRAITSCDASFVANVGTLPLAIESLHVLSAIQRDLFYTVGWPSWAGWNRLEPSGRVRQVTSAPEHAYLARLSAEAVERYRPRWAEISAVLEDEGIWNSADARTRISTTQTWPEGPQVVYEVTIESDQLSMVSASPAVERATQFAGIYEALQADIPRLFRW
jgi:hypothetical protein